eukprot:m.119347 g.119347  ORF g.119347 m.119347 type:complete len:755 (+) comp15586_c0_seq1:125-2389(+)
MTATLELVKVPSADYAIRNRLTVHPDDIPDGIHHVRVRPRDAQRAFAFSLDRAPKMKPGTIGANTAQREWAYLSLKEALPIEFMRGPFNVAGRIDVEVDYWKKSSSQVRYSSEEMSAQFRDAFGGSILSNDQVIVFAFQPKKGSKLNLRVTVKQLVKLDEAALVDGSQGTEQTIATALCSSQTQVVFEAAAGSNLMISGGASGGGMAKKSLINPNWNFEDMGIGGLDDQFTVMFRRAFASRVMPIEIVEKLGIQHVKGILLFGPPGTGKTLMARKIGQMLEGREPKIVNGPEILSKYVGEAEANIRALFEEAETEYKAKGEMSSLHIIIFDEIDAICKTRGSVNNGTGVNDSIVNQLLSKIDGVEALNNILLIGMTNRPDMLDDALTRPGRLELKMEISLPDHHGRVQIFQIHTKQMKDNKMLADDVVIDELAELSKNFSGAEIAGVCRSAASFATNRCIKFEGTVEVKQEMLDSIKVERQDFLLALGEVIPAFGAATEEMDSYCRNGVVKWGDCVDRVLNDGQLFIQQVKNSTRTPQVSVLLAGPPNAGKTALAATLAMRSEFPLIKMISPETMVGYSEFAKVGKINKVFEDAYKSTHSVIVIDDLERLLDYVPMGSRFSNVVLQALLVLLKKRPPKGHKLLIIGTTSNQQVLGMMGVVDCFSRVMHVDSMTDGTEILAVLEDVQAFEAKDMDVIRQALSHGSKLTIEALADTVHISIGVKKLYMLIEMARQMDHNQAETFLDNLYEECKGSV